MKPTTYLDSREVAIHDRDDISVASRSKDLN
jgi:hypothetical protein